MLVFFVEYNPMKATKPDMEIYVLRYKAISCLEIRPTDLFNFSWLQELKDVIFLNVLKLLYSSLYIKLKGNIKVYLHKTVPLTIMLTETSFVVFA